MLENVNKKDVRLIIKNISLVVLGTLILAFGTSVFIIPLNLVVGGMSGLAVVVSLLLPEGFMSIELIITILTWLVFFLGLIILGKSFALKTLVSAIVYPVGVSVFSLLARPDVFGGFFVMDADSALHIIVAVLFGGVMIGIGCAVTFMGGGSTGGTDILGFIICKFVKKLKSSTAIGFVDAAVVLSGLFAIKNLVLSLLGIVCVFIIAICIDKIFIGTSKSFVAHIITKKYDEINQAVATEMDRTTTIISVVGGFSKCEGKMLMVSFTMRQYSELINIINKHDKNAFVTIHVAHEISGEGWTR
jgi:uncharacterized membrane-anchored protein YitT (DUF2179 family)